MRALGEKSQLMRQKFVSQVSCKGFGFGGKIRLSQILAKSFVFSALFSTLLCLWLVSGELLQSCCLLPPLCTVYPWLLPLCFGAVRYSRLLCQSCHMNKMLHWYLMLGATNWKMISCSSPNQNEEREAKDDTHYLALPVRMFYPVSCMCSHDVCSRWNY